MQNCLLIETTLNKSKYFTYAVVARGFLMGELNWEN
jgi:hypothetical protein